MKGYEPADSYSTCDGLKQALGRVPSRGIPRIGALNDMSYGVRQLVMTVPGGSMTRIGPQSSAGGMLALKRSRLAGSNRRLSCRSRSQVAGGNAAATLAPV
jgi:hypothetical protein